jgi:hypothetical protein
MLLKMLSKPLLSGQEPSTGPGAEGFFAETLHCNRACSFQTFFFSSAFAFKESEITWL